MSILGKKGKSFCRCCRLTSNAGLRRNILVPGYHGTWYRRLQEHLKNYLLPRLNTTVCLIPYYSSLSTRFDNQTGNMMNQRNAREWMEREQLRNCNARNCLQQISSPIPLRKIATRTPLQFHEQHEEYPPLFEIDVELSKILWYSVSRNLRSLYRDNVVS